MRGITDHITDKVLFVLFFFYGLAIHTFNTTDISLVVMSVIAAFYIVHVKNENIDPIVIYVLFFWAIVNFFSWVFVGGWGFEMITFTGSLFKLFIGYSFAKMFGLNFLRWFEKTVFFLALISVPMFIVQLYNPDIFKSVPFNFVYEGRRLIGDWNGLIFNYADAHDTQNSGFAGEPGTFGYYIGLAMIFNLILNNGRVTPRILVFILIGLTTFSTNFYLTLVLFVLYFIWQSPVNYRIAIFVLFIPICLFLYQLPFVGKKINDYVTGTKYFTTAKIVKSERINRMAAFTAHVRDISEYPFGYGVNKSGLTTNIYGRIVTGTNDFSSIAVKYGVVGFIFFILIINRLFRQLLQNRKGYILLMLILFMYMAANSMERDYYAFSLFWLFFVINSIPTAKIGMENYRNSLKVNNT